MQQFWRVLTLVVVVLALLAAAPPARSDDRGAGAVYRVSAAEAAVLARAGAEIEGVGRGFVDIRADALVVAHLRARGYAVVPLARPRVVVDPTYHTYAEMTAEVQAVAAANPAIVALQSIGRSYEGRELLAAKVSDNVGADEDEPEVLFVGHYHAREHLTVEMVLDILHMLVDGYGTPEHATIDGLVDSREIWLIFDLNPDGGAYDIADGTYRYWRKNREPNSCATVGFPGYGIGTDLNRNHSYRWGYDDEGSNQEPCGATYRGPSAASAPEVAAIEQFVNSRVVSGTQQINAAISFHTYGELVLWPYGYTYAEVPADMSADDAAALAELGQAMARTNGYVPQQSSDLYPTNGDFSDWAYGAHRIFAYTFEMTGYYNNQFYDFYPPGGVIAAETARNRAAVLLLLQSAACPYLRTGRAASYCQGGRFDTVQSLWLPVVQT